MGSEVKIFGGMYYHRYSYVVCMRVAIYYLQLSSLGLIAISFISYALCYNCFALPENSAVTEMVDRSTRRKELPVQRPFETDKGQGFHNASLFYMFCFLFCVLFFCFSQCVWLFIFYLCTILPAMPPGENQTAVNISPILHQHIHQPVKVLRSSYCNEAI